MRSQIRTLRDLSVFMHNVCWNSREKVVYRLWEDYRRDVVNRFGLRIERDGLEHIDLTENENNRQWLLQWLLIGKRELVSRTNIDEVVKGKGGDYEPGE